MNPMSSVDSNSNAIAPQPTKTNPTTFLRSLKNPKLNNVSNENDIELEEGETISPSPSPLRVPSNETTPIEPIRSESTTEDIQDIKPSLNKPRRHEDEDLKRSPSRHERRRTNRRRSDSESSSPAKKRRKSPRRDRSYRYYRSRSRSRSPYRRSSKKSERKSRDSSRRRDKRSRSPRHRSERRSSRTSRSPTRSERRSSHTSRSPTRSDRKSSSHNSPRHERKSTADDDLDYLNHKRKISNDGKKSQDVRIEPTKENTQVNDDKQTPSGDLKRPQHRSKHASPLINEIYNIGKEDSAKKDKPKQRPVRDVTEDIDSDLSKKLDKTRRSSRYAIDDKRPSTESDASSVSKKTIADDVSKPSPLIKTKPTLRYPNLSPTDPDSESTASYKKFYRKFQSLANANKRRGDTKSNTVHGIIDHLHALCNYILCFYYSEKLEGTDKESQSAKNWKTLFPFTDVLLQEARSQGHLALYGLGTRLISLVLYHDFQNKIAGSLPEEDGRKRLEESAALLKEYEKAMRWFGSSEKWFSIENFQAQFPVTYANCCLSTNVAAGIFVGGEAGTEVVQMFPFAPYSPLRDTAIVAKCILAEFVKTHAIDYTPITEQDL